ncbi:MAG: metal-sensitive transcriptional regulator [Acidimicrobiales bacterium]
MTNDRHRWPRFSTRYPYPYGYSTAGTRRRSRYGTGLPETKTKQLAHLRRIEGQVRGLHRMVEDDTYCIDVLTQLASVTKSLQSSG